MPPTFLRLRLPEKCLHCGVIGRVRPEHTIRGASVTMMWCCHACGYEWPIADNERELPERRMAKADRRRMTRAERRRRQKAG